MAVQEHQNAFTVIRWVGALMVLIGHSFVFLGLPEPVLLGWAPLGPLGVYIFFTISGYLVAKSWESDPSIMRFLFRRALRILPGLWVCIVLTAFVLGPFTSTLSFFQYFDHPLLKAYLSNFYLYISYALPGVFQNNIYPNAVNGSLWSLPVEIMLYFLVAATGMVFKFLRLQQIYFYFVAFFFLVGSLQWGLQDPKMFVFYGTDMRQFLVCGGYFWVGYVLSVSRFDEKISISAICVLLIIWFLISPIRNWFIGFSYLVLPCLVIVLGNVKSKYLGLINRHDYSYGIYIYAFPLQQMIALFFPGISLLQYLIITVLVVVLIAAVSWHWVEKPALSFKPAKTSTDRV